MGVLEDILAELKRANTALQEIATDGEVAVTVKGKEAAAEQPTPKPVGDTPTLEELRALANKAHAALVERGEDKKKASSILKAVLKEVGGAKMEKLEDLKPAKYKKMVETLNGLIEEPEEAESEDEEEDNI